MGLTIYQWNGSGASVFEKQKVQVDRRVALTKTYNFTEFIVVIQFRISKIIV